MLAILKAVVIALAVVSLAVAVYWAWTTDRTGED